MLFGNTSLKLYLCAIIQILKVMAAMEKILKNQQTINEAARDIIDYFAECGYTDHLENFLDVQTQIIGLMDLAKQQIIINPELELEVETDQICVFLRRVKHYLNLMKPIIKMKGED